MLRRVQHPNVVTVLSHGALPDGRAFIVTELLSGIDLEHELELRGRYAPAAALEILSPLCEALEAAHAEGVIHRDIKASNVFVCDPDGERRIVVLDFGLAKIVENDGLQLTTSRMALGTPASMAPEQLTGKKVDHRADVYAVAGLAYQLLSGQLPFSSSTRTQLLHMHMTGKRPQVSAVSNLGAEAIAHSGAGPMSGAARAIDGG